MMAAETNKLGLIAGGGDFPVLLAREASRKGWEVYVVGFEGLTSRAIEEFSAGASYYKLGQVSRPLEMLKSCGVKKIALAGLIRHTSIFGGYSPDLRALKILARMKDMRAESIFAAIRAEFADAGMEMADVKAFLEKDMAGDGVLCGEKPSRDVMKSVSLGWKVAKELAKVDVGLACVVCGRAIVAVEAMEGTDACIARAGEIMRSGSHAAGKEGGLVVVKVARPGQDLRFDLPVIGAATAETMKKAGAVLLAVEAGKTLIIEKEKTFGAFVSAGITLIGVENI